MILSAIGQRFYTLPGETKTRRFAAGEKNTIALAKLIQAKFLELKPTGLICGGSLGFDLVVGRTAWLNHIPYILALPDANFQKTFPVELKPYLIDLITGARRVHIVSGKYAKDRKNKHLRWKIERADCILGFWDGNRSEIGQEIMLAWSRRKHVDNLWSDFVKQTVKN